MVSEGEKIGVPIFRDIRRYYCEYCGICRSKKTLISSHILSHHQDELKQKEQTEETSEGDKLNTCDKCGASFQKPAHLKQHMQSHSLDHWIPYKRTPKCTRLEYNLEWISTRWVTAWEAPSSEPRSRSLLFERPFTCPVDDCHSSYRRKDHLTRHMLQHQGKLFECPVLDCKHIFAFQGNMKRHMNEFHDDGIPSDFEHPKEYACAEPGCGKVFKYASKLRKHEESHVKLDTVEALCSEPGCLKYFSNEQCLKEHIQSCHQYIDCDKCGTKQLKKNMKRHIRTHEAGVSSERIKCSYEGCLLTFSTTSNLNQHIKAVHLDLKPFTCSIPGCHMKFAFKHVRDNHEKSGCHVYTLGDFEESDEQFRSRPRGGRKREYPVIETLMRKRVVPPSESDLVMNNRHDDDYLSWLHSAEFEV